MLIGGVAAGAIAVWLAPHPAPDFDALKGALVGARMAGAPLPATGGGDLTLRSSSGLEIEVLVLVPAGGPERVPAVVVFGGLQRGRGAVDLAAQVAGETPVVLAAMDYPYEGDPDPQGWAVAGAVREARPALYRTVAGARLLLDFLARHPRVRPDRIILVGVSLGGPIAVAVGGMDPRPAGVASLFGAGLADMLGHALRPRLGALADAAVPVVAWHLRAVDAGRHAPAIAPRPFLVVGGRGDRRIPVQAIEALAKRAGPAARVVWLDTPHPDPVASVWLRLAADATRSWLAQERLIP